MKTFYTTLLTTSSLVIFLTACSSVPAATVASLETSLTAADRAALLYLTLPPCPAPPAVKTTVVCSDATVKATIKVYEDKAYKAIKAVQASPGTGQAALLTIAEAALADYTNAIPAVPAPVGQ